MFANCEQVSLSETEETNVLSLTDITHIGSTGLDLVENLQDKLKAENPARLAHGPRPAGVFPPHGADLPWPQHAPEPQPDAS